MPSSSVLVPAFELVLLGHRAADLRYDCR